MPIRITNNRIYFNDGSYIDTATIDPGDGMPSGTRMFFYQTTAPTNWTKDTTYNNVALRVINGTVASYTGGMTFTSALAAGRSVSGTISISVGDHSTTTGSTAHGVSIQNSNVTGLSFGTLTFQDNLGTETVTVSFGTTDWAITPVSSTSVVVSTGSGIVIGTTSQPNPVHNHSAANIGSTLNLTTQQWNYLSGLQPIDVVTNITLNTSSATTGLNTATGGGANNPAESSSHEHGPNTVAPQGHFHTVNPAHNHIDASITVPLHAHTNSTLSASFDNSGNHGHTTNTTQTHNHSISLSHSASGSFTGNAMDFNVNYIDFIIAQKV